MKCKIKLTKQEIKDLMHIKLQYSFIIKRHCERTKRYHHDTRLALEDLEKQLDDLLMTHIESKDPYGF